MNDEVEDIEFEIRLAEKRHNELKNSLNAISNALSKDNDDKIVIAIEKQTNSINQLSTLISKLPTPEKPEVSIEVNQDKVISSLNGIAEKIIKSNSDLLSEIKKYNERPILDKFKIVKDSYGNTKTIELVYKNK